PGEDQERAAGLGGEALGVLVEGDDGDPFGRGVEGAAQRVGRLAVPVEQEGAGRLGRRGERVGSDVVYGPALDGLGLERGADRLEGERRGVVDDCAGRRVRHHLGGAPGVIAADTGAVGAHGAPPSAITSPSRAMSRSSDEPRRASSSRKSSRMRSSSSSVRSGAWWKKARRRMPAASASSTAWRNVLCPHPTRRGYSASVNMASWKRRSTPSRNSTRRSYQPSSTS